MSEDERSDLMETRFLAYIQQLEQAETTAEKQAIADNFARQYDRLTPEEKTAMRRAMQPSLETLKQWTEQTIDPLIERAEALLAKKVA